MGKKAWILCLIGLCAIGALIAKHEIRNFPFAQVEGRQTVIQLDRDIRLLYENGKSGKVVFIPNIGHRIEWPLPTQKTELRPIGQETAITYGLSGGRLGDNLLSYLHARWIAYRDHVPLALKLFPMADEFALSQEPQPPVDASLLEIPYFPEPSMKNQEQPFAIDWDDPGFREEIARCLAPTKPHSLLELPPDRITLCVHVRRGGSFDSLSAINEYPLKFPPDSYYIEQIQTIARIFEKKPLYVFLMTDDPHPEELVLRYQKSISHPNIQWNSRKKPPENALDDFFSIPRFDCLILCDSNFSIVASKLAQYAIKIAPTRYSKNKEKVRITGLEITFNPAYSLDRPPSQRPAAPCVLK